MSPTNCKVSPQRTIFLSHLLLLSLRPKWSYCVVTYLGPHIGDPEEHCCLGCEAV
jgi:hypothetical protein